MKRAVFCAVLLLWLCAGAGAQVKLTISGIGLNDYVSNSAQAVSIQVGNSSPHAASYVIEVQALSTFGLQDEHILGRYRTLIQLGAGESRQVDFPVTLPQNRERIRALVYDSDGHELARREVRAGDFRYSNALIAAICDEKMPQCTAIWSSILANSNDEQDDRKQKKLSFIAVRNPGLHFWNYSAAKYMVLARPAGSLSAEARNGIEEFARRGGILIWLSKEVGPTEWLSAYRQGNDEGKRRIGRGSIYVVPTVDSPFLSEFFNRETNSDTTYASSEYPPTGGTYLAGYSFPSRNSTHFDFPSLRWLLLWLLAYIFVAGFLNFAILRKLRRLEWGWLTIPVIAVLFAGLMFAISSARRPKTLILDQTAIYYMDHRSPLAAADYTLRVSSPRSVGLVVDAPGDAVWNLNARNAPSTTDSIAREIFDRRAGGSPLELRFGDRTEYPTSLLRWSYEDIFLEGMRTFEGTVVQVSPTRFRNETGVGFRSAMFVDSGTRLVYMFDKVPNGAEVDLSKVSAVSIDDVSRGAAKRLPGNKYDAPYSLPEVFMYGSGGTAFYALADGPPLGARLKNENPTQHSAALFIVGMQ